MTDSNVTTLPLSRRLYIGYDDHGQLTASAVPQSRHAEEFEIDVPREGSEPGVVLYAFDVEGDRMLSFDPYEIVLWAEEGRPVVRIERLPVQTGSPAAPDRS